MTDLLLAVDIAEVIARAANDPAAIDIDQKASALVEAHPEARSTQEEVAEALLVERTDAGVIPPKPSEF